MEVDKYNLEGGIRAMRQAALWLTQWADDLEKADRAGGLTNAAGPPDRPVMTAAPNSEPASLTEPNAAPAPEPASATKPNAAPAPAASSGRAAPPTPASGS